MQWPLLLLIASPLAGAFLGFDAAASMTKGKLVCMRETKYEFFIGRVWKGTGNFDNIGMSNIRLAHEAEMPYVDGFFEPCLSFSCAKPANQLEATINKLRSTGTKIGDLWIVVESDSTPWPSDQAKNQQTLLDLVAMAKSMGQGVGIYTNYEYWNNVVGDWSGCSHIGLWWKSRGGFQDFNDFTWFGGWMKPSIRQYTGTVGGPCGFSIDRNWYPDA